MQTLQDIIVNKIVSDIIKEDKWNEEKTIEYPHIKNCNSIIYNLILEKLTIIHRKNFVKKYIKKKFEQIEESYEIVDQYTDGITNLGNDYYVPNVYCHCKNGFEGEDWEVSSIIKKEKFLLLQKIIFRGVKNGNVKIRVHESLIKNPKEIILLP